MENDVKKLQKKKKKRNEDEDEDEVTSHLLTRKKNDM